MTHRNQQKSLYHIDCLIIVCKDHSENLQTIDKHTYFHILMMKYLENICLKRQEIL
jgi:hypothetical protein